MGSTPLDGMKVIKVFFLFLKLTASLVWIVTSITKFKKNSKLHEVFADILLNNLETIPQNYASRLNRNNRTMHHDITANHKSESKSMQNKS